VHESNSITNLYLKQKSIVLRWRILLLVIAAVVWIRIPRINFDHPKGLFLSFYNQSMLYYHMGGECIILTIACIITAAERNISPANSWPLFCPLRSLATEAPHFCGLTQCQPLSHLPWDLKSAFTGTLTKVTFGERILEHFYNYFFYDLCYLHLLDFPIHPWLKSYKFLFFRKSFIILSNSAGQFGLGELIWNKCALSRRWCSSQSLQANGEQTPTPGACLMIAMRLMCFHC
jgi:hypothetical protein